MIEVALIIVAIYALSIFGNIAFCIGHSCKHRTENSTETHLDDNSVHTEVTDDNKTVSLSE